MTPHQQSASARHKECPQAFSSTAGRRSPGVIAVRDDCSKVASSLHAKGKDYAWSRTARVLYRGLE